MREFILVETETVLTELQYRELHSNILFPENFTPMADAVEVVQVAAPEVQPDQVAERNGVQKTEGVWYQSWYVRQKSEEELEQEFRDSVPEEVTVRQADRAMYEYDPNFYRMVDLYFQSLPGREGDLARIDRARASTLRRDNQVVINAARALGLTERQLDELFIAASKII